MRLPLIPDVFFFYPTFFRYDENLTEIVLHLCPPPPPPFELVQTEYMIKCIIQVYCVCSSAMSHGG